MNTVALTNISSSNFFKSSFKLERKIVKVFLLKRLHQIFCEKFQIKIGSSTGHALESYLMDTKIIQFLIKEIIESGEYTLEGIAHQTRIPFDVIYDAACGICNQFSITPWVRIVDLYIQVKPELEDILIEKLLETKNKNNAGISLLLNEIKSETKDEETNH